MAQSTCPGLASCPAVGSPSVAGMTTTLSPQQLATIYLDAWQSGDADRLRSILAESVTFRGPLGERDGRDACVEGLIGMRALMTGLSVDKMLADEQDVMTWYDLETEQGALPTVNWSHVEDGLITVIRATVDPRALL